MCSKTQLNYDAMVFYYLLNAAVSPFLSTILKCLNLFFIFFFHLKHKNSRRIIIILFHWISQFIHSSWLIFNNAQQSLAFLEVFCFLLIWRVQPLTPSKQILFLLINKLFKYYLFLFLIYVSRAIYLVFASVHFVYSYNIQRYILITMKTKKCLFSINQNSTKSLIKVQS